MCIENAGHEASLVTGKVYKVIKPLPGDLPVDLRVIDEEGEDYLYSSDRFIQVELPRIAQRVISALV